MHSIPTQLARQFSSVVRVQQRSRVLWLLGAVLLVLCLELFTSVAPVQRASGAVFTALSAETKRLVLSEESVERLENVEREVQRYRWDQTVRDRTGHPVVQRHRSSYPPKLRQALIAVENSRYDQTFVLDYWSVARVLVYSVIGGEIVGGASGIAQQAARRIVLHDRDVTLNRKLRELLVALELRSRFDRDELLTFYMTTAYLGRGIEGFGEAARAYFGEPLSDLTAAQYIMLVGMLDRPNAYVGNSELAEERYLGILRSLRARRFLSEPGAKSLRGKRPFEAVGNYGQTGGPKRLAAEGSQKWASVAHYVRLAADKYPNRDAVTTALDVPLSVSSLEAVREAVRSATKRTGVEDVDGFVIAGLPNGQILTLVGARLPYRKNQAMQQSSWRPGSLMKPLLYASMYDAGLPPTTILPVQPGTWSWKEQSWSVRNYSDRYDNFEKGLPAAFGLSRSLNVPASFLAQTVFGDSTFTRLRRLGIDLNPYPANLLGSSSFAPVKLFRGLLAFTPPFGRVPSLQYSLDSPEKNSSIRVAGTRAEPASQSSEHRGIQLYSHRAAHNTALNLGLVVDDTLGTGRLTHRLFGWTSETRRMKTGTAQRFTSASLWVTTPSGLSVLMAIFSRSGTPLTFDDRGMTGAALTPFVHRLLDSEAAERYTQRRKTFGDIPNSIVWLESPSWMTPLPWSK